jgi:hypothetical protein
MTLFRPSLLLSLLALLACPGCTKTLEASSYDTSCKQDSDCVAVYFGTASCPCPGPDNGAINNSDLTKYEDDLASAYSSCTPTPCPPGDFSGGPGAVCSKGTCTLP